MYDDYIDNIDQSNFYGIVLLVYGNKSNNSQFFDFIIFEM